MAPKIIPVIRNAWMVMPWKPDSGPPKCSIAKVIPPIKRPCEVAYVSTNKGFANRPWKEDVNHDRNRIMPVSYTHLTLPTTSFV